MVRRTKVETELTRSRIVEAALAAFAASGVRGTTLEDVAVRAGVTRGAVYWHFADKPALVSEMIAGLEWPLDIGADIATYHAHPQPLQLLLQQLWGQMERCVNSPSQWRTVRLVLRHGVRSELPSTSVMQVEHAVAETVRRLGRVMTIARHRRQLRAGLSQMSVARGLHAVGVGMLSEHTGEPVHARRGVSPLCLELFLLGASATGVQAHCREARPP